MDCKKIVPRLKWPTSLSQVGWPSSPSFRLAEERGEQRSAFGVSKLCARHLCKTVARIFTHPDTASLVHPLFRKRERGEEKYVFPLHSFGFIPFPAYWP